MRDRIPREEVEKWLRKLKKEIKKVEAVNEKGKEFLENIKAYVHDTEHFLKKRDLFLAWEACLWAWAYLSISKELKLLKEVKAP